MAFSSGSTPPLTPHLTPSPNGSSTLHIHSPAYSRSSTPELTPEQERARRRAIVQPAFFYPNSGSFDPVHDPSPLDTDKDPSLDEDARADALLDPAEDPRATRGIPVFRPTMDDFADFERFMERVEPWGRRSGIIKIIPPKEWSDSLSSTAPRLSGVRLKNPIEQHMEGRTGLYRQQNEERRHTYSVRDWAGLCSRDGLRAPAPRDIVQQELNSRRSRRSRKGEDTVEDDQERSALVDALRKIDERGHTHRTNQTLASHSDTEFYDAVDPKSEWLPTNTAPEDYSPAVCRALERHFWRNCGLGKDPMYGADMQGTLFDHDMKTWNVSCLPNVLERLLPDGNKIPGVNTPYLYFGMWRATFAWHVEDMDLYSINYIHWGAPKYWYAIPSQRAEAFEDTMRKHFPTEASECPQFMRHKSFLASPAILAEADCRPNTLVQHQGEFVITYPRGYHAGFNVGFNCAESVNFALESWIEIGRRAQFCKCVGDSVHLDVDAILAERDSRNALELDVDNYPQPPPSNKRKEPATHEPSVKRPRHHEPGVTYATAAELERLPTIRIKIKPLKRPSTSPYRARTQPTTHNLPKLASPVNFKSEPNQTSPRNRASPHKSATPSTSLPRLKIPLQQASPCFLCSAVETEGLLPVLETPSAGGSTSPSRGMTGPSLSTLRIHEDCAQAIPETWVAEVGGKKFVCGVETIVKDRWALKCSLCDKTPSKTHGAKIQCAKGRCPKAFHVTCAKDSPDVEFTLVEEGALGAKAAPSPGRRLKKPKVTALCPQHNPRLVEARKADKQQKLDADIGALTQYSRIKVRASGGVFAVTLVNVYEDRRTVEVIWDQGGTKEFRYSSVVWTDDGDVQEKPMKDGGAAGSSGSHPSPAPVLPDRNQSAGPSLSKATGPSGSQTPPTQSNPTSGHTAYAYQAYSYYPYPPAYSHSPPSDNPVSQPQSSVSSRPPQAFPPQPHHAYSVPMPVPMPYPYSYGAYNAQHSYSTQPQFYPAHGYHYPPITTYHPAAPAPSANVPSDASSNHIPPATGSNQTAPKTVANAGNDAMGRPPTQSYVGVRPASSQDILNGAHQARART